MENNNYKVNLESLGLFQPIKNHGKDEEVSELLRKYNRLQHICRYITMSDVLRNNIVHYYNRLEINARMTGRTGVADALAQYCDRLMNAGHFWGNNNRTEREFKFQAERLLKRKAETKDDVRNLLEENVILGYLFNQEPRTDIARELVEKYARMCQAEIDELVQKYGFRNEKTN